MQSEVRPPIEIIREFQFAPPVDVDALAQALGLHVTYVLLSDHLAGSISKAGDAYEIKVNKQHYRNRQRFTLAHEIAHFVLHRDMIGNGVTDNKLYRSHLSNYHETQANRLAADILMPKAQVELIFLHSGRSVEKCAMQFEVSRSAMEIRLKGLGLLTSETVP
jgi:Zn-dependent peptidase ImmA (M78 family)